MINFKHISTDDRTLYEKMLFADTSGRGCEFSFANLYLWGRQTIAHEHGCILMFSQFDRRSVYPFPLGDGDVRGALDAIISDSKERGIPCRITGIRPEQREFIEKSFPGKFRFHTDRGSYDYVYAIDNLAELAGKKYDGKRNHINKFKKKYPGYRVEPINSDNLALAEEMVREWYEVKEDSESDFHMEKAAIARAFRDYEALGLEGLLLLVDGKAIALTMGSKLSNDTFDVHFEKALTGFDGAYAMINCEFAKYIREKYTDIKFLDREEDMGLEGLRRAKESYQPHHLVEKCWACLLEDGCDY